MEHNAQGERQKPEILIVDDLPNNVTLLEYILGSAGYRHRAARDGQEALQAIAEKKPDLVLLDLMMPDMSGYEVCAQLRAEPKTRYLPVVIITAHDTAPAARAMGLQVQANDYIAKPISPDELIARIDNQLSLRNMNEQRVWQEKLTTADRIITAVQRATAEPLTNILHSVETLMEQTNCAETTQAVIAEVVRSIRDNVQSISDFTESLASGKEGYVSGDSLSD